MHRSRSREKPRRASYSGHATFADGNVQSKRRIKVLRTDHDSNCECGSDEGANSITLEFKRSSRNIIGMPIKELIDEEMSREKHIKRSSPSLIARLMGLDTLPSPGGFKPLKEVRSSSRTVLSKELHEQVTTPEDCSLETSNVEHQEFKDVFEVAQAPQVGKQKEQIVQKGISNLRWYEMDKAFIRHSFVDATSPSDEMLQRPEELVDAVEVLDSKNLPFLQEPSRNLHDLGLSPSTPKASYPLILMESKDSLSASCESSFRSERNSDRYTNSQRRDSQSFWELAANLNSHPSREHVSSLLKKLPEPICAEKDKCCAQPTQIVILKPSLDKALKAERNILSAKSLNNFQQGLINYRKFPIDEIMELCAEERARRKVHRSVEIMGHNIKGSRDITEGIPKPMRNNLADERKKVSISKLNDYEGSFITPSIKNWNSSQASHYTSANLYDYTNSSIHTTFCPAHSSVNREARKRLSERWKLTNHIQEMGLSNRGSSTLADMLALSDNETSKVTLNMSAVKKAPDRKFSRDDLHEPRNHPLGISSKDGWKDGSYKSFPRSKSLPATSLLEENFRYNSRNRLGKGVGRVMLKKIEDMSNGMSVDENFIWQKNASLRNMTYGSNQDKLRSDGEENASTEREIHVSSEELKKSNDVDHPSEKEHTSFELPKNSIAQRSDVDTNLSVSHSNTVKSSLIAKEKRFEELQDFTESEINEKQFCDKHELPSKEALVNRGSEELPARINNAASVCPENYKEADQPSPVSVLDLQFEVEEVTSGCFEKISADLQELRLQLRLLKQESVDSCAEDTEALISSDEDAGGEPFPQYANMLQAFKDEEDRDYSYVLDILIDCGILKSKVDGFFSTCHSTKYPVGLQLFDELEKKYKSLDSWSRPERKLLFDLTNSILADMIMPFMSMPSWGKPKIFWQSKMVPDGLVEEVWQAVVKKMNNSSCSLVECPTGLKWLDIGDGKELVGRQLEKMLQEDLVDELVIELNYSRI